MVRTKIIVQEGLQSDYILELEQIEVGTDEKLWFL